MERAMQKRIVYFPLFSFLGQFVQLMLNTASGYVHRPEDVVVNMAVGSCPLDAHTG